MKKKIVHTVTCNVQTMLEIGKLAFLIEELETLNMNITGRCETRWKKDGKFTVGNSTICFSGNETGRHRGVAIILDKHPGTAVKSFNPVSDRILILKINTKPVNLNIIQAYAPISTSSEEDIDFFFSKNGLQDAKD